MSDNIDLFARLAAPFRADEVEFKPAVMSKDGNRALALCYIDARAVMDRLDEVVGGGNWQDQYEFLPDGSCLCKLSLRLGGPTAQRPGGEWITKSDVGGESDQKDEGDRRKSAVSDALKRAAVKFGVGRYLYRLEGQWVEYDQQKKQFARVPQLPAWALPPVNGVREEARQQAPAPAAGRTASPRSAKKKPPEPTNGQELRDWLGTFEAWMVERGQCGRDDVVRHVRAELRKAGYDIEILDVPAGVVGLAVAAARAFQQQRRGAARQTVG